MTIACVKRKASIPAAPVVGHGSGNFTGIPCWEQKKLAQNVPVRQPVHWHIHDWFRKGQIHQLGPNPSSAGPPMLSFLGTVVVQGTLALDICISVHVPGIKSRHIEYIQIHRDTRNKLIHTDTCSMCILYLDKFSCEM
jgi:hypothetical protein